ncbi:hypothetical protein D4764_05G0012380 [Takifugu flavidus]|uniref:Uncharacterized protein n=1 Tax=Takifugu flavidus TaxID=433684 RepID=A0A5C6N2X7_9TELE|nr:hypothetical protein D4764_05G0012380 [Takifugu flavidus]
MAQINLDVLHPSAQPHPKGLAGKQEEGPETAHIIPDSISNRPTKLDPSGGRVLYQRPGSLRVLRRILLFLFLGLHSSGQRSLPSIFLQLLVFFLPDVAITWDCYIYHNHCLLVFVYHHYVRELNHVVLRQVEGW